MAVKLSQCKIGTIVTFTLNNNKQVIGWVSDLAFYNGEVVPVIRYPQQFSVGSASAPVELDRINLYEE